MPGSLFRKQLVLYIGILFVSFGILGFTLSRAYSGYYISQKEEALVSHGKNMADQYASSFYSMGIVNYEKIMDEIKLLEETMGANVFLVNLNKEVYIVSSGINPELVGQAITDDAIDGVLNGDTVTVQGSLTGLFNEPVLTVGYPITIKGAVVGGIIMCISMPEIERSLNEVYKAGILSIIISVAAGSILVYISTARITRPLMEMNRAAKVMAGGNFENVMEIKTRDEVGQLAESFNFMAESLAAIEKNRREFIANVSHDLRSPLTSMQGFLCAMLDGTIPKEENRRYIKVVLEETKRLGKLANGIADLSLAQSSGIALDMSAFDLNTLIREVIETFEPEFRAKSIRPDIVFAGERTFVYADRDKIRRVFQNLIDNAIKFTPRGGRIEVETSLLHKKNKVLTSIADSGAGISPEDRKYIFDRFYKADSARSADKTGMGLGLAIAREFIMAHGESIGVSSPEGGGAIFAFTIKMTEEGITDHDI